MGKKLRGGIALLAQLIVLLALVAAFFMRVYPILGPSMEPQFTSGEYVVINTVAYRFAGPQRGDIVAFLHRSEGTEQTFIKRVIGLPGDRVSIDRGQVVVNGTPLQEPYVLHHDTQAMSQIVVAPGQLFVLGDNRPDSEDSRAFGSIAQSDVVGRAIAIVWPLPRATRL
ncbi:MAG: signal peptidase I [Vulcanimicrobiaceae bacterium]